MKFSGHIIKEGTFLCNFRPSATSHLSVLDIAWSLWTSRELVTCGRTLRSTQKTACSMEMGTWAPEEWHSSSTPTSVTQSVNPWNSHRLICLRTRGNSKLSLLSIRWVYVIFKLMQLLSILTPGIFVFNPWHKCQVLLFNRENIDMNIEEIIRGL